MMARSSATMFLLIVSLSSLHLIDAQTPIPPKYDGFPYKAVRGGLLSDSIIVEAFFDPVCPDSRDSWPPLKRVLKQFSHRISLIVHPFPLPYHDNAFVSCRALHIANKLNASTTYPLLEKFFKDQEKFYNKPTHNMSRASVVSHIAKFMSKVLGNSSLPDIESGFEDTKTDQAARVSFKYGCSRGVTGTPYFFVNGFPLPGAGSPLDYNQWRSIIDPLLNHTETRKGPLHLLV
ncbi:hypothetical protein H6P81_018644 [Aristolochia fimbriata]|uniref:Thioredoxin-like fold domain-containing protein n=1 Tax=Aristolochia fimbriata TaxID=158543 RepID=A0AAV7E1N3_ARIFI|nr:hypothetical protein H6P81_018644 [Aristolochia fimbriata]